MSMTESEAKIDDIIETLLFFCGETMNQLDKENLSVAIDMVKEREQYRAIGTVEDIQMVFQLCKDLQVMCGQYNDIGTVSEFRELKEKATAKKPIVEVFAQSLYERKTYRCPSCNHKLISKIDGGWCGGTISNNCEKCGTALDWCEGKE